MKTLTALILLLTGAICTTAPAMAEATSAAKAKKHSRQAEKEIDINGMEVTRFSCELGNKLTIYSDAGNTQQIALRWKNNLHRMTRISTTSGAQRFENAQSGLVWIGIPAKGMLLDSKKGRQLANECKSAAQREVAKQKF